MLKIVLTGGIGSGKSTVAKYFAKLGVPIIDADEIVHKLLAPNTDIYQKIILHFGNHLLNHKKNLDRNKLKQIIFSNKKNRLWLEKLIHPRVRAEIVRNIKSLQAPYCVISVPLFFETKFPPKMDRILVVDCPKHLQIKRIRKRNRLSIKQIKAIIAAQTSRKIRLQQADDIICNAGTTQKLQRMVKKLHNYYLSLT